MPRIRNLDVDSDSHDSDKSDSEQLSFPMPAAKRRRISRRDSIENASHKDTSSDEESSSDDNAAPMEPQIGSRETSSLDFDDDMSDDKDSASNAISSAPTRISRVQRMANPRPENVQKATLSPSVSTMDDTFAPLSVAPWLVHTLASLSITKPTAIQQSCIPPILAGRDCIGLSQTGSGKTIAFALPILQKWAEDPSGIYAVVLTPTRELALQIYEQFQALGAPQNLKVVLVTGGTDMSRQAIALSQRPHIVVATPGRLADHIQHSGDDTMAGLRRVKAVVFDEADRLLVSGPGSMLPDVNVCLTALPPRESRQTLMFTATETPEIRTALSTPRGDRPPILRFEISDPSDAESSLSGPTLPSTLRQTYLQFHSGASGKLAFLHVLLQTPSFSKDTPSIMIFTNRTATADHLHRTLLHLEHPVTALHSDLPQRERTANLSSFRALKSRILVATDVASRGLDITSVAYVINYDVPRNPVDYVHRVGRTARAGREGLSVTFVGQRDVELVLAIEAYLNGEKMVAWEEEGVNLETRVVKSRTLKDVGEARMEALREVEQGRDVNGRRKGAIKKARKQ